MCLIPERTHQHCFKMKYTIAEVLKDTKHRTWDLPKGNFRYYQEWNDALFFHWKIAPEIIQELLPKDLVVDTIDGNAWISLVAFTMEEIRPKGLPAVSFISNFDEINLRTYVIKDGKPGVYFLNIEAGNSLASFIARSVSGLPYEYAPMRRNRTNAFQSASANKGFSFKVRYQIGKLIEEKTELDEFLTERYCLYVNRKGSLYRYDIHHKPWVIDKLWVSELETNYHINGISLNKLPNKMHYSKGVQVVAWNRIKV